MNSTPTVRNLLFIFLGVTILILKRYYDGPGLELINSYASNFSVSFACYFIGRIAFSSSPRSRLLAVIGALLAVELFELTNGFGIMTNVYDPWDYLANILGIGLGAGLDLGLDWIKQAKRDANG